MLPDWHGVAECKMFHSSLTANRQIVYASGERVSISFDFPADEERFSKGDDVIVAVYRIRDDGLPAGFQDIDLNDVGNLCGRAKFLKGQLADMAVDLGLHEECPEYYEGDGIVKCGRALRSMLAGWMNGEIEVPYETVTWLSFVFKYIWRFPLKGQPKNDLMKALDCLQNALDAWERKDCPELKQQIADLKEEE